MTVITRELASTTAMLAQLVCPVSVESSPKGLSAQMGTTA